MAIESAEDISNNLTLPLLVIALGIFFWIVIKSRSIRNFQSQISIFIIIWIMGEITNVLQQNGLFITQNFEEIGLEIHVAAMVFFSVLLWFRFYYYYKSQRRLADNFEI